MPWASASGFHPCSLPGAQEGPGEGSTRGPGVRAPPPRGRRRQRPAAGWSPRGEQGPGSVPAAPAPRWGPGLAAFLGGRIDYFDSLFAGDINLAGSRDGCVLTSHPGLDSSGSRCPGPRSWRRVSRAGSGASGLPGTEAGMAPRLRSPPTCLPPNRRGELLKMQFPFIFPVKSLPVP